MTIHSIVYIDLATQSDVSEVCLNILITVADSNIVMYF
jgi:hypothetical protein